MNNLDFSNPQKLKRWSITEKYLNYAEKIRVAMANWRSSFDTKVKPVPPRYVELLSVRERWRSGYGFSVYSSSSVVRIIGISKASLKESRKKYPIFSEQVGDD
jgi:hypothetical protein